MDSKFRRTNEDSDEEDEVDSYNENMNVQSKFAMPKPTNTVVKASNKFDPLDWKKYFVNNVMIEERVPVYWSGDKGPTIICLHGAGHSANSFAYLASLLSNTMRIASYDFRGHGTNLTGDKDNLSQDILISDTIEVLDYLALQFPEDNFIMLGHSMGGSIATKTLAHIFQNEDKYPVLYEKFQGLIVIDVVEGTAMDALPFMESIVKSRPKSFKDEQSAIQYMVKSNTIKHIESARISVPTLIERNEKGTFVWKTDLLASQVFWKEWFLGLTQLFLSIKVPKLLLLAASDRMDKELTIAQMQGKFKLSVVKDVGHIVHEDNPKGTADVIRDFIQTFRIYPSLSEMKPIVGKLGGVPKKPKKFDLFKGD